MAWTELTRRKHAREGNKYASDLTDAEWALIAPLMPPPKTTGRPRTTRLRDVLDAILRGGSVCLNTFRAFPKWVFALVTCSIPDDHIDPRRSALFMARSVLREAQNGDRTC